MYICTKSAVFLITPDFNYWCRRPDSNRHGLYTRGILSPLCLPFHHSGKEFKWRRHPDLNRGIKVLQTSALPLGYGATSSKKRRIDELTISNSTHPIKGFPAPRGMKGKQKADREVCFLYLVERRGFEPLTFTLPV